MKAAAEGSMQGILGYTEDQVVSSDFMVMLVPPSLMPLLELALVIVSSSWSPGMTTSWLSNRVLDLIRYMAQQNWTPYRMRLLKSLLFSSWNPKRLRLNSKKLDWTLVSQSLVTSTRQSTLWFLDA